MKSIPTLSALVLLGLSIGNSYAAPVATAEAFMDWSKFSVSTVYGSANIAWSNQTSTVDAYTYSPDDSQWAYPDNWNPSNVIAGNSTTQSQSAASTSGLRSYVIDSNTTESSAAGAYSSLSGDFTVSGSGVIIFSVPYILSATLIPGGTQMNFYSDYADAGVSFSVYEYSSASSGSLYAEKYVSLDDQNAALDSPISKSDTLTLAMVVKDGDHFSFYANNYANANVLTSVPVPTSIWLLGSGLLGLVGVARRKTA